MFKTTLCCTTSLKSKKPAYCSDWKHHKDHLKRIDNDAPVTNTADMAKEIKKMVKLNKSRKEKNKSFLQSGKSLLCHGRTHQKSEYTKLSSSK